MSYTIYVIELKKKVFTENRKFREANPQFNGVLECLYVGMTSKTPQQRFDQHINGVLSNNGKKLSSNIVKKYGIYLRPSLYQKLKLVRTRTEALRVEKELALELRRQGYAVWFACAKNKKAIQISLMAYLIIYFWELLYSQFCF